MTWTITSTTATSGTVSSVPVVSVVAAAFQLEEIHFATPSAGGDFHYLYQEADTQPNAPGSLSMWGLGPKIVLPEWTRASGPRWAACFTALRPVAMRVRLVLDGSAPVTAARRFRLWVRPTLDGSEAHLTENSVEFTLPGGASEVHVDIATGGRLPEEISRYSLRLRWAVTSPDGRSTNALGPNATLHSIYGIKRPLRPDFDSPLDSPVPVPTTSAEGTLTGTKKRLDLLTRIIGGSSRRCRTAPPSRINSLFWELHKGINDTPGAPPFFDAGHDEHLTRDGSGSGTALPVTDQWLAWCPTAAAPGESDPNRQHWNDASCIGHVQLLKTMAASVGLFARRTWIFPHTRRLPDGSTWTHVDTDLYALGTYDPARKQYYNFPLGSGVVRATCVLMEPELTWENFEACLRTPNGKFLPGGYATSSNPAWMRSHMGFRSAAELIGWWSGTTRERWRGRALARPFRRFMAWAGRDGLNQLHFWDVDGNHYDPANVERIRDTGKQLPPP